MPLTSAPQPPPPARGATPPPLRPRRARPARAHAADVGDAAAAVGAQRHDLTGEQEPGTEDPGLLEAPLAELRAAQPAREAQIVADQRAGPGLATDRGPLDHQRA